MMLARARRAAILGLALLLPRSLCIPQEPRDARALPSPLAHWDFEDVVGDTVRDRVGERDGTLAGTGSLPEVVPGIAGQALKLRPDEGHCVIVRCEPFDLADGVTVMAWVRFDSLSDYQEIIGHQREQARDNRYPLRGFRLLLAAKSLQFRIGDGSEQELVCAAERFCVPEGHWAHVAGSYDGRAMRVYVNAAERAITEVTAAIAPQPRPLVLGRYLSTRRVAYPFRGLIDDVRIYGAALSQSQILQAAAQALGQ
ncbi:MAG: LamG domain-containing protein [Armatimonadota bacterium]